MASPLLILGAILNLLGSVLANCSVCECTWTDNGEVRVDCSDRGLFNPPDWIPLDTTHLDLSRNNLHTLLFSSINSLSSLVELKLGDNGIFLLWPELHAPQLERLELQHNKIFILNRAMFQGLPSLRHLDLRDNVIEEIMGDGTDKKSIFRDLTQLECLDLSENALTAPPAELLQNLVSLQKLNISSNQVSYLSPDLLYSAGQLETVDLSGNLFLGLPIEERLFRGNNQLRTINLSYNRMLNVHERDFSGLPHLQHLDLSHNMLFGFRQIRVSAGDKDSFGDTLVLDRPERLRYFDISHNVLRRPPMQFLYTISGLEDISVGLSENSLQCSEENLRQLIGYLDSTKNTIIERENIRCVAPDHLLGQTVGNFTCPKGASFEFCASPTEPTCATDIVYPSEENSDCTARCVCPPLHPINLNGVCRGSGMCEFTDVGRCFKDRSRLLHSLTLGSDVEYIPACDASGHYRPLQCDWSNNCWCSDKKGNLRCGNSIEEVTEEFCTNLKDEDCPGSSIDLGGSGNVCALWGNGRVRQIDGSFFQVKGDCYYGLVSDVTRHSRYHLYVRVMTCHEHSCLPDVHLYVDRTELFRFTRNYELLYNNTSYQIEPHSTLKLGKVTMQRQQNLLRITTADLELTYSHLNYLVIQLNDMTNVVGACGTISQQGSANRRHAFGRDVSEKGFDLFENWALAKSCEPAERMSLFDRHTDEGLCSLFDNETGGTPIGQFTGSCSSDLLHMTEAEATCGNWAVIRALYPSVSLDSELDHVCG